MPLLVEEMIQAHQEERAETSFARVRPGQVAVLQQLKEELLRQVLRIMRAPTESSDVSVERIPIGLAKTLEGFAGLGRASVPRGNDDAPVRRREQ